MAYYYVTNHGAPNVVIGAVQANDGKRSMTMAKTTGSVGKEVEIAFRLVTAATILGWKTSAQAGNSVSVGGYTGVIASPSSIQYQNELVQDTDLTQVPSSMDYWKGTLKLISTS
jgi:hypothetical protein